MPMLPPAPPTFSTTIGWPSTSRAPSETIRPTTSDEPPGGKPMTRRIGFVGYFCACAGAASTPAIAHAARTKHRRPRYDDMDALLLIAAGWLLRGIIAARSTLNPPEV